MYILSSRCFRHSVRVNIVVLCVICILVEPLATCISPGFYTNEYQLKIKNNNNVVVSQAQRRFGLVYQGKIVSDIYSFIDPTLPGRMPSPTTEGNIHSLKALFQSKILEVQQVVLDSVTIHVREHSRKIATQHILHKREAISPMCSPYYGMKIEQAWASNYTGLGVTVAAVDNGADVNHTDLKLNINQDLSRSFFNKEGNVAPQEFPNYSDVFEEYTDHGNNVAGLIAAQKGNEKCAAGVGFNASLVVLQAVQLSSKPNSIFRRGLNDNYIADALKYRNDKIDIYSVSINHIKPYREPKLALTEALRTGTNKGRQGKGCIYVFSAGDTRDGLYDCNVDPYVNSVYTITIGSVGINGSRPEHSLRCSCILASTFWGTTTMQNTPLVTTSHYNRCSHAFEGSSASAPLASGIITLLLQANPTLTWRDVQYLIVLTSSLEQLQDEIEITSVNAAGLPYNPYFGFGLMDALALVSYARNWTNVPARLTQIGVMTQKCQTKLETNKCGQKLYMASIIFPPCELKSTCISHTEHVVVHINYTTISDHETELVLRSPAGTLSVLKSRKPAQTTKAQRETIDWNFQSVQLWGENPHGEWKVCMGIQTTIKSTRCYDGVGIHSAVMTLYGVATLSSHIQSLFKSRSKTNSPKAYLSRGPPNTCSDQAFEEGSNIKCRKRDETRLSIVRDSKNADPVIKESEDDWLILYIFAGFGVLIVFGVLSLCIWTWPRPDKNKLYYTPVIEHQPKKCLHLDHMTIHY